MKSTIEPNNFKKDYWFSLVTYFCAKYTTLALFFRHLGLAYLISSKRKKLLKRIPLENWLAWVTSYPFCCSCLIGKSVLNYWPKPNGVNDLLNTYNESIVWLCVLIPILVILIGSNNTSKSVFKNEDASFQKN